MRDILYRYAIFCAIILCMSFGSAAFAEDTGVFDVNAFSTLERPVSQSDHDTHMEYPEIDEDCSVCHHVYEDGKLVEGESSEDQACSDCHTIKAQGSQPGLRTAYHDQCKGCHIDMKKGPVACGECHVR